MRPAKRTKISVACQRCRARKVRCDGGRPTCLQCIIGRSECAWPGQAGPSSSPLAPMESEAAAAAAANSVSSTIVSTSVPQDGLSVSHSTPGLGGLGQQVEETDGALPVSDAPSNGRGTVAFDNVSLQWMMDELGVTYGMLDDSTEQSSQSSSMQSSADGARDTFRHPRDSQESLDGLTWTEVLSRAFGLQAWCSHLSGIEQPASSMQRSAVSTSSEDGTKTSTTILDRALCCLSARFRGLKDVRAQEVIEQEIQTALEAALRDVGLLLKCPDRDAVKTLAVLAWCFYGDGEMMAAFSYSRHSITSWSSFSLDVEQDGAPAPHTLIMADLLYEMTLRVTDGSMDCVLAELKSGPELHHEPEGAMSLLTAGLAIQQAAIDVHQLLCVGARLQDPQTASDTSQLKPSVSKLGQAGTTILHDAQTFYNTVGIPFSSVTKVQLGMLESIEQRASQVYEGMPSSAVFNVNNFSKQDRVGLGTPFLALHIKYEATMCYIYQIRAQSVDEGAYEEIITAASAARSLADDLVVAEAVAPWTIAANASLDRYIFIAAVSILISFKVSTGSYAIAPEAQGKVGPMSTRKRLLGNVLRQNFSACLQALALLAKFWAGSKVYLNQLETIITAS